MTNQKRYRAFSLFEVVISIVVLGVILAAFPAFFISTLNTAKINIKEEIFFEEAAVLNLINLRYFDENSTKDDNFYKDLNATLGDSELLNNYNAAFVGECRRGKSFLNNNKYRSGSSDTLSNIGLDSGEDKNDYTTYDDVDDFNGTTFEFVGTTLKVRVDYISDETNYSANPIKFKYDYFNPQDKTNIKLITVYDEEYNITLRYPVHNIGASKYLSLEEISR